MPKASFFVTVLSYCSIRDTELLIQAARQPSSLKQDKNSTGQGADDYLQTPVEDNKSGRRFKFENSQNLVFVVFLFH